MKGRRREKPREKVEEEEEQEEEEEEEKEADAARIDLRRQQQRQQQLLLRQRQAWKAPRARYKLFFMNSVSFQKTSSASFLHLPCFSFLHFFSLAVSSSLNRMKHKNRGILSQKKYRGAD